jgi:Zinc knuckle
MASTGLELEAEHWQQKEDAAARCYTRALELRAQLAEEAVGQHQDGSHPNEERMRTVDEARAARRAVESRHRVHNAGLTGNTRHVILPNEGPQRACQPATSAGTEPTRLYDNPAGAMRQSRERSVALTDGQGILDNTDGSREPYDGITQMIHIALADAADIDPEKSLLAKAGVKLKHPETYSGGSDVEEFEGFIANILRWLKTNYLLGRTSTDLQVSYLGTCLTGEAQEWFHINVAHFDRQVRDWTLEMVIQGLQKRFLHTLTYHHASNKFNAVMQGTKTVQKLMNELTKYVACMIQQPDEYMLRQRFVSALRDTLRNEVLKKGYNAETSSRDVLCDTACMIEEASRYNQGMRRAEAASTAASAYRLAPGKPNTSTGLNRPAPFVKSGMFQCVPPQRPAQAGKAPEAKPPQAPGSSAKPNYPPKQQMPLRPQNWPQNSTACFECGQPGHIRANCPKLKQGLRTAATRQDDDVDPDMDPADDPDLLIEGEVSLKMRIRKMSSSPMNGSLKRLNTNLTTKRTRRMPTPSPIKPARLESHQTTLLSPVPRVQFPSFGFGTRSAFRNHSRVRFPSVGFGTRLAFLPSPRFLYISPRT